MEHVKPGKTTYSVIVYIDGLNLYEGIKDKGWKKFLWLDLEKFAESLLIKDQKLICVKYFTTRISYPYEKQKRQAAFIDAISTLKRIECFYGNFKDDEKTCERCRAINHFKVEKQTDVNIATEMLVDAYQNKFDTAILISGDSDLVAPIKHIRNLFPEKIVKVAFPPERHSSELGDVANVHLDVYRANLRDSQFPDIVIADNGFELKRPDEWK